jgi:hypothetical protein
MKRASAPSSYSFPFQIPGISFKIGGRLCTSEWSFDKGGGEIDTYALEIDSRWNKSKERGSL